MRRSIFQDPATGAARVVPNAAGALMLAAAGLAIYWNSFSGVFVYDDYLHIRNNPSIRTLWPPWAPMQDTNRPIGFFSFAVNYSLHGNRVGGYHAANLAIHVLCALVLYGIVRRTLSSDAHLAARYGGAARGLALAVAMVWMVHPLQTQSVTYIYQRLESLMGLFYLLTLYLFIRGASGARPGGWYAASIACCALGMGTKEVMVSAPLVVLWYDRAFVAGSWREIAGRRAGYYAGLVATWGILAALMASQWSKYPQGGVLVGINISPLEYALSQPGVIVHYLRLSLWPADLCLDYAWPVAAKGGEIVPPLILIGVLLGLTLWGAIFRPAWGFLGGWFFLILAPTSSIAPIKDLAYEHRMYLPLAGVAVLAVVGGFELWRQVLRPDARSTLVRWAVPLAVLAVVVAGLGVRTHLRNEDYRSEFAIWSDTLRQRPDNAKAHLSRGIAYRELRQHDRALNDYGRAIELDPNYADAFYNRGNVYRDREQFDLAIADYSRAIQIHPDYIEAYNNRSIAYFFRDQYAEAWADVKMVRTLGGRSHPDFIRALAEASGRSQPP